MKMSTMFPVSMTPFAVARRTACAFACTAFCSLLGKLLGLTRWFDEPVSKIHTGSPFRGAATAKPSAAAARVCHWAEGRPAFWGTPFPSPPSVEVGGLLDAEL